MDVSGVWSEYDDVLVDVRGLPEPAQIEELYINSDLYYLELSWDLSEYTEGNFPEGYDGEPMIASKYEIYYQGEDTPIVILEEVDENDESREKIENFKIYLNKSMKKKNNFP